MPRRDWTTTTSFLESIEEFGQDTGWRDFLSRYEPPVRSLIRRMGFVAEDADDVFQDVMLSFATAWSGKSYDPARGSLSGWLLGIAHRRIVDALDRRGRDRSRSAGTAEREAVESWWKRDCRAALVDAAVTRLRRETDARGRLVLEKVILDDASANEVAERLGLEANAVYQQKFRLLRRLREIALALEAGP